MTGLQISYQLRKSLVSCVKRLLAIRQHRLVYRFECAEISSAKLNGMWHIFRVLISVHGCKPSISSLLLYCPASVFSIKKKPYNIKFINKWLHECSSLKKKWVQGCLQFQVYVHFTQFTVRILFFVSNGIPSSESSVRGVIDNTTTYNVSMLVYVSCIRNRFENTIVISCRSHSKLTLT